MNAVKAGHLALFVVLIVTVVQTSYYWTTLPPRVASSFDAQGQPKDRMSKTPFVLAHLGIILSMIGAMPLLWLVMRYTPARMINLPHRDYWLAPERLLETRRVIMAYMAWFFVATALLLSGVFQLACLANLGHPEVMRQTPLWLLGMYTVFTVGWIAAFYRRFRRPREA